MTDEQIDAALLKQKAEREQELINMESAGGVVSGSVPTPQTYKKPGTPEPTTRPRSNAISGGPAPAAASEPAAHPAPVKLPEKFKGEDTSVGWRAFYGAEDQVKAGTMPEAELNARKARAAGTGMVTDYHTPEKQASNTLGVEESGALTARGKTADFRKTEYAMSPTGDVVANLDRTSSDKAIGPDGKPQQRNLHHSSMLAGGDVAHAGHIGAAGGKVNYLDDDSGHYKPDAGHTFDAFSRLAEQGSLDPNSTSGRVNLVDKTVTKGIGPQGKTADVHFSGYQQSGGNEKGIRAKGAMLSELTSKVKPVAPSVEGQAPAAPAPPAPPAPAGGGMVFDPNAAEPSHYENGGGGNHYDNVPGGGGNHYDNVPNSHYENVPGGGGGNHYDNVPGGGGLNSHYENGSHYEPPAPGPTPADPGHYDPNSIPVPTPPVTPAAPIAPAFGAAPGGLYGQYIASDMPAPAQPPYAPSLTPATPPTPAPPTPYAPSLLGVGPAPANPDPNAAPTPYSQYAAYLPPERR